MKSKKTAFGVSDFISLHTIMSLAFFLSLLFLLSNKLLLAIAFSFTSNLLQFLFYFKCNIFQHLLCANLKIIAT